MIKKILEVSGKLTTKRFRIHLETLNLEFLEEVYQDGWAFYDDAGATFEHLIRTILEQLDIESFHIDIEE